jgi:hypothetical protein
MKGVCMSEVIEFARGGFRFVRGVFQYSAGVAALPGYRIERARFARPVALAEGFARIAGYLNAIDRPLTAFCACELRSPAPFDDRGFFDFNKAYAGVLGDWGLLALGDNPVARSNVCPEVEPPERPGFHAFSYTVPARDVPASFVIAGSGESIEGHATYAERTVAYRDLSPAGLRMKAAHVHAIMEARMAALGFGWADTTATQVYCVHDIYPFLADDIVRRGAARHGILWHFNRPPVIDLEYEVDCRGVHVERVLG